MKGNASFIYRGSSLIRKRHPVGPYRRIMPRDLQRSWGGLHFLMSEVPVYRRVRRERRGAHMAAALVVTNVSFQRQADLNAKKCPTRP